MTPKTWNFGRRTCSRPTATASWAPPLSPGRPPAVFPRPAPQGERVRPDLLLQWRVAPRLPLLPLGEVSRSPWASVLDGVGFPRSPPRPSVERRVFRGGHRVAHLAPTRVARAFVDTHLPPRLCCHRDPWVGELGGTRPGAEGHGTLLRSCRCHPGAVTDNVKGLEVTVSTKGHPLFSKTVFCLFEKRE